MKKLVYIMAMALTLVACQKHSFRTVFPSETPEMTASMPETSVTYGADSVHLNVHITAKQTPLSTLTVLLTADRQIIKKEVLRTKDMDYQATLAYALPFGAGMVENATIKAYLTAENVEGDKCEMIVNGPTAKRVQIEHLYMVSSVVSSEVATTELTLVDAEQLIYAADVLYPNNVSVYFTTAVTKFGRVDWNNATMVFGSDGKNVIVAADNTTKPVTIDKSELMDITHIEFDAINFTVSADGTPLTAITKLDLMADLEEKPASLSGDSAKLYRGNTIFFGPGVEIEFSGYKGNLEDVLSRDWFEVTGSNKAKFLGEEGLYKAYYKTAEDFLIVEYLPDVIYPDALWVCGEGMGQPSATPHISTSWNWNSPSDYFCCRKVSNGVFQFTAYLKNEPVADAAYGTVNFKYFHNRGWDGEEAGPAYTITGAPIFGSSLDGKVGNWLGTTESFEGIYTITLDINKMTNTYVKIK